MSVLLFMQDDIASAADLPPITVAKSISTLRTYLWSVDRTLSPVLKSWRYECGGCDLPQWLMQTVGTLHQRCKVHKLICYDNGTSAEPASLCRYHRAAPNTTMRPVSDLIRQSELCSAHVARVFSEYHELYR